MHVRLISYNVNENKRFDQANYKSTYDMNKQRIAPPTSVSISSIQIKERRIFYNVFRQTCPKCGKLKRRK